MDQPVLQPIVYTIEEAARLLALNPVTIRRMIEDNQLYAVKVRGSWRIPVGAVDALLRGDDVR